MRIFLCFFFMITLFTSSLWSAEIKGDPISPSCTLKEVKEIKKQSFVKNKRVHVDLKVMMPGRVEEAKSYRVLYGSTAADLLKIDHQVENGVVCCRPDDIKSVDGLDTNFTERRYWTVAINGSMDVSPNKTLLNDDDHVLWTYHEGDK